MHTLDDILNGCLDFVEEIQQEALIEWAQAKTPEGKAIAKKFYEKSINFLEIPPGEIVDLEDIDDPANVIRIEKYKK